MDALTHLISERAVSIGRFPFHHHSAGRPSRKTGMSILGVKTEHFSLLRNQLEDFFGDTGPKAQLEDRLPYPQESFSSVQVMVMSTQSTQTMVIWTGESVQGLVSKLRCSVEKHCLSLHLIIMLTY